MQIGANETYYYIQHEKEKNFSSDKAYSKLNQMTYTHTENEIDCRNINSKMSHFFSIK